jgi:hypothetical protein
MRTGVWGATVPAREGALLGLPPSAYPAYCIRWRFVLLKR